MFGEFEFLADDDRFDEVEALNKEAFEQALLSLWGESIEDSVLQGWGHVLCERLWMVLQQSKEDVCRFHYEFTSSYLHFRFQCSPSKHK